MMLIARAALLVDDDIVDFILHIAERVGLCKVREIIADLFCVAGAMGDLCDLLKIIQSPFRLKAFQYTVWHGTISLL